MSTVRSGDEEQADKHFLRKMFFNLVLNGASQDDARTFIKVRFFTMISRFNCFWIFLKLYIQDRKGYLLHERPKQVQAFPQCMDHKQNKSRREAAAALLSELGY